MTTTEVAKKAYVAVPPHGSLERVSEDVYIVPGSYRMAPGLRVSLTMVVVRRGNGNDKELTIVNSMRVNADVEDEIKKLGDIKHVVRICSNHGASDEYYVDTYGATYHDLPDAATTEGATKGPSATSFLEDGKAPPSIPDAKLVFLKNLKMPDAVLYLPDDGGMLVAGDFVQNGDTSPHDSFVMRRVVGPLLGFNTGCLTTPPPFFKFYGKGEDVYVNVPIVMEMEFDTIICAHGPIVKGGAKEKLREGFAKVAKSDMWKSP